MLVRAKMTSNPVTVTPQDTVANAQERMRTGGFRRLPVVQDGTLVGIVTDRDIRLYEGLEEHTKVRAVMTAHPVTVSPQSTVEDATQLMLKHKVGGLPVLDKQKLVGIITTSDILQAFLEGTGAIHEASVRIDFVQKEEGKDLAETCRLVEKQGGDVLGMGTYLDPWSGQPICYLRLRAPDPNTVADTLRAHNYVVLSIQKQDGEHI
jgi:acetoin utilization protein AcuB